MFNFDDMVSNLINDRTDISEQDKERRISFVTFGYKLIWWFFIYSVLSFLFYYSGIDFFYNDYPGGFVFIFVVLLFLMAFTGFFCPNSVINFGLPKYYNEDSFIILRFNVTKIYILLMTLTIGFNRFIFDIKDSILQLNFNFFNLAVGFSNSIAVFLFINLLIFLVFPFVSIFNILNLDDLTFIMEAFGEESSKEKKILVKERTKAYRSKVIFILLFFTIVFSIPSMTSFFI